MPDSIAQMPNDTPQDAKLAGEEKPGKPLAERTPGEPPLSATTPGEPAAQKNTQGEPFPPLPASWSVPKQQ